MVDTNVLVYAADADAVAHDRCRGFLQECRTRRAPWYLTWSIVYEFLRVTTHPRVFRRPWSIAKALDFVDALLESPGGRVLSHGPGHAGFLAELSKGGPDRRGNLLHDAHTAALMREHGLRVIYTRDVDFHRFPSLEVRAPLA